MSGKATGPRVPSGVGTDGRKLWRDVVGDLAARGLELRPDELTVLAAAARQADTVARLERALLTAPLVVLGSAGQPVTNPLLTEARLGRSTLAQMLGRLRLGVVPEQAQSPRSRSARRAANARWSGAGMPGRGA